MDVDNIEDLRLPQAVIARLIKEALPPNVSVSKEAKTAIARSAAIFVLHATTYANEYAKAQKRKNVTAEDVIHAIKILECDELEKSLNEALEAFRAQRQQKQQQRDSNKQKKRSTFNEDMEVVENSPVNESAHPMNNDDDDEIVISDGENEPPPDED